MNLRFLFLCPLVAALFLSQSATAQGKKPLTPAAWDIWKTIQGTTLSADGRWVAYSVTPQVGDGTLVVRSTSGTQEYVISRGFTGRPQTRPAADSGFTAPPPQFSADGRHLVAIVYAPRAAYDSVRRQRKGETPKSSLAIVDLSDGKVTRLDRVKSFRMPRDRGRHLAYHMESADSTARRDSAAAAAAAAAPSAGGAAATPGGQPRPIADSSSRTREKKKQPGTPMVVRELASGVEVSIPDVIGYAFHDSGSVLGYTTSSQSGESDGAYLRFLAGGNTTTLVRGAGNYKQLIFDRAGTQVAFMSDREEYGEPKARYALYHASVRAGTAAPLVRTGAATGELLLSDRRLDFTRDGSAIVLGLAPAAPDSIPADSLLDKAVFDLWTYRDLRLQPQQRVEAERDRVRAFTAVYQIRAKRLVQLGNDTTPAFTVSQNGRFAIGTSSIPYAIESMWGEGGSDVYLADATTGARRRISARVQFGATLSPSGKYAVHFDSGHWFTTATATGKLVNLSRSVTGVRFDQENWDTPSTPAPWGIAGWTTDDRSVLINDRFDVWEFDPAGVRAPRMITDSVGRRERLAFRLVDLDRDDPSIDPAKPLLFRVFDEDTKESGFYRDRLGVSAPPERIAMGSVGFGAPLKARNADVYVVTQSTFNRFGDLWAGPSLDQLTRLSDANSQQSEYRWGNAELVRWRSTDGVPLQGILFTPEDFDPKKQYPMVVYFYEQLSQNLYSYGTPGGRNVINPAHYVSNGYLVFEPDIDYSTGYPGPSAMKSIVPGVQALIERGFVDPNGIGIQGQSWGGYQVAYMITQTNMFRAAMAGAPVANMTSAYGGIRWQTGLARSFQYEKTQSRIGGSLWQYPLRYIENSPLFQADRVRTPLMMMHNDNDGAVPWYQGIEMFVALRRLGREVYLINYNGDEHNPTKRANQKDIAVRMQQFFDHHLRGKPAPDWMTRGIPFLDKGRDQLAPPTTGASPVAAGGVEQP